MAGEILTIKQEISEYYLNEFKNELGFLKKMVILPIESNIKKVIIGEINEPSNISDIFEGKDDDGFFDKILNGIKKQWGDLFISSDLEFKLLSFMKEKRKEIEKRKTKLELEALKSVIIQKNTQHNQNNRNKQSSQSTQHNQGNQGTQYSQNKQSSQGTQYSQNKQSSQGTQYSQNKQSSQSTQRNKNKQSNQDIQPNKSKRNKQSNQDTQNESPSNQRNNGGNNSIRTNYTSWGYANTDRSSTSYEIDHLNFVISSEMTKIYNSLKGIEKPDLEPFACGLKLYNSLKSQGRLKNTKYLTIVDFTKPKSKNRMFVINTVNRTVEHAVTCGHGKGSGRGEYATSFSNVAGSNKSSLGGYITPDAITKTTRKSGWYGLRQIQGIESTNSASGGRGIAIHPGGVNGSEGCFTIPKNVATEIMGKQKGGSLLFAYAESREYFAQSNYFHQNPDGSFVA